MAKNTTATGSTIDGVTVVHPDNMGNTLVFKDQVYNVNVGDTLTVGENGLVDVKLSPDNGNLLEARENGLYYGVIAPKETYNLYVSSESGDDSNDGSINSPLKTIDAAWYKNRPDQDANIWLKAGETFTISGNLQGSNGSNKTINVYGNTRIHPPEPLDGERFAYRFEASKSFPRPTIRLKDKYGFKAERRGDTPSFIIRNGSTLSITGVNFDLGKYYHYSELHEVFGGEPALGYWSGSFFYGEQGLIKLFGCNITIPETTKGLNRLSSTSSGNATSCHHLWYGVRVNDQRVDKTPKMHLIAYGEGQTITFIADHIGHDVKMHRLWGFPDSDYQRGNIDQFLKDGNHTDLRMSDPNKSYPININTNIDF